MNPTILPVGDLFADANDARPDLPPWPSRGDDVDVARAVVSSAINRTITIAATVYVQKEYNTAAFYAQVSADYAAFEIADGEDRRVHRPPPGEAKAGGAAAPPLWRRSFEASFAAVSRA